MNQENDETEWWWIDYLEDELDPQVEADLQMLLRHSPSDRNSFESFRLLRSWLRESDPVGTLMWKKEDLQRLKTSILETISEEEALLKEMYRSKLI